MTVSVECLLGGGQDLYHFSLLHGALVELEANRRIQLHFRHPRSDEKPLSDEGHSLIVCTQNGKSVKIGIDLYDRANHWSSELLSSCDRYYKRSFQTAEVSKLPPYLAQRVRRLGLNYAVCSTTSRLRVLRESLWGTAVRFSDFSRSPPWRWRDELDRFRQFWDTPQRTEFERQPEVPAREAIVFQPRLWEPGSTDDDVEKVNQLRVDLVRSLRREFGHRFAGGLVPTAFARNHYPDLLTAAPTHRKQYVRFSLAHAIGISTRGLHGSIPFKLPEYFAGSFCVLSDEIVNEIPEPLRQGIEIDTYKSADHCIALCVDLLSRPDLIRDRRMAAWEYYQKFIRADALWDRRIREAFAE